MLNGTWRIETEEPATGERLSPEYLPNGTIIQLQIGGPSRAAIQESRLDELGGSLTVMPYPPAAVCLSGLADDLCTGGIPDKAAVPVGFNAVFNTSRWTPSEARDIFNEFFVEAGAKQGSLFVLITVKYPGVDFELWLKNRDELVGRYVATPKPRESRSVTQVWHRLPAQAR